MVTYFALQSDNFEDRQLVHVGVFVKMAGIFWKNSLILKRHVDIINVLHAHIIFDDVTPAFEGVGRSSCDSRGGGG